MRFSDFCMARHKFPWESVIWVFKWPFKVIKFQKFYVDDTDLKQICTFWCVFLVWKRLFFCLACLGRCLHNFFVVCKLLKFFENFWKFFKKIQKIGRIWRFWPRKKIPQAIWKKSHKKSSKNMPWRRLFGPKRGRGDNFSWWIFLVFCIFSPEPVIFV